MIARAHKNVFQNKRYCSRNCTIMRVDAQGPDDHAVCAVWAESSVGVTPRCYYFAKMMTMVSKQHPGIFETVAEFLLKAFCCSVVDNLFVQSQPYRPFSEFLGRFTVRFVVLGLTVVFRVTPCFASEPAGTIKTVSGSSALGRSHEQIRPYCCE